MELNEDVGCAFVGPFLGFFVSGELILTLDEDAQAKLREALEEHMERPQD